MGLGFGMFYPKDNTSPTAKPASTESNRLNALIQDATPDAPVPLDFYRLALNALLTPWLDDDEPSRLTDAAIDLSWGSGTSVMIDGEPLVARKALPAVAFTVR